MKHFLWSICFSLFLTLPVLADPLSVEYFSKRDEFSAVKVSPEGDYVSAITDKGGKNVLAIFDRETFNVIHAVYFDGKAQVGNYYWVNKDRVVVMKEYISGIRDEPLYYGEMLAVNADGSKVKNIISYKSADSTGTRVKKAKGLMGTSFMLDPLLHDKKHILVSVYPWASVKEPFTEVFRVNVYNGKRKQVTRAPARMATYLTDNEGEVRFAASSTDYIEQDLYIRDTKSGDWSKLDQFDGQLNNITPYAFDETNENVFATANKDNGTKALYKIDLATANYELISQDKTVSPSNIWLNEGDKSLYAVEYEPGYPTYEFVDKNSPMTKSLKGLLQALPGYQVRIISSTLDGKVNVIWAGNDRTPGEYYVYDKNRGKLDHLLSARSWIDPDKMAEAKPIQFTARDGLTIHGYLTLPQGKEDKNLPLVVMPHGGPHGVRDWWSFNPTAQMLANNGIAVLQVNFRGSGGYGTDFEHAGHRRWGEEVQYDIIDGVKHLIAQGTADKDNLCILGGSFGGYSALQSAIIEPDMFKCSVGEFGIYSLPMMFTEGDVQQRASGVKYLKTVLGEDESQLKAFSPVFHIDKLKAPVLLIHGAKDKRAPIEHAEALIKAFEKHNHDYEYFELEAAGHGIYSNKDRAKHYQKVLDFIKQHLDT